MKTLTIVIVLILVTVGSAVAETCYDKYTMHPVPCNDKPARTCWEYSHFTDHYSKIIDRVKKLESIGWEFVYLFPWGCETGQDERMIAYTVILKRHIKCGGAAE